MVAIVGFLSSERAQAGTIISNLAGTSTTASGFVGDNGSSLNIRQAVGFTTAAGRAMSLDNIVMRLKNVDTTDDALIHLFSDSSGPNSALLTFTDPANTAAIANHTLTPTSSFTLAASTTYWIVATNLNASSPATFTWVGKS